MGSTSADGLASVPGVPVARSLRLVLFQRRITNDAALRFQSSRSSG